MIPEITLKQLQEISQIKAAEILEEIGLRKSHVDYFTIKHDLSYNIYHGAKKALSVKDNA